MDYKHFFPYNYCHNRFLLLKKYHKVTYRFTRKSSTLAYQVLNLKSCGVSIKTTLVPQAIKIRSVP
jgi:hypothetical protein